MNNQNQMTWRDFKSTLEANPDLHLQFRYNGENQVKPSYHITEIKQAPIVSVDCGGVMNAWTEVIVQLWEPEVIETGREKAMQVNKALSIINLVEKSLPLHPDAIVKIEFGNTAFDTRQLYPQQFEAEGDNFIVNLTPDFTQCKALSRGESCGPKAGAAIPAAKPTPKIEMYNAEGEGPSCAPGSGCC
ncbi:DUF6428 family protein [Pedobacter antarcticus]|uniref:DUF6428 family protein n=1 Tax=Pedobacter antarcticus TaxID=34086 RepID=UPI00292E3CCA|nr:DUF6428 family protein [Pedobacter antarcticus]